MLCKIGVFKNSTKFILKHLCWSFLFNKVAGLTCSFLRKETMVQLFLCEFCQILKEMYFVKHLPTITTVYVKREALMKIAFLRFYWKSTNFTKYAGLIFVRFYLIYFSPMLYFCTWKRQQTKDFLKFSGGIEMKHWAKID